MSQRNERSTPLELQGVTGWLIHHAARRAPECLSSRLEEEWLADLESRSTAFSRLRLALGCCWATVVIVSECSRSRVPAATSAAARGYISLTDRDLGYFSLRSGTLFLVAGLHAALFYGLITTLSHTRALAIPPNLQNQVLKPVQPKTLPPPLPPGIKSKGWVIDVQKLVADVPPKIDIENDVTTQVVEKSPETYSPQLPPEPPTHVVRQVAGGPGAGFPDTADFYPSLSVHLGEEGMSTVRVCVDRTGKLIADPTTVKSSGSARLDGGAIKLARAGSGHYRATTEDGQPVNSCYPLGIRFQLKK
jgi:hypothetical protein